MESGCESIPICQVQAVEPIVERVCTGPWRGDVHDGGGYCSSARGSQLDVVRIHDMYPILRGSKETTGQCSVAIDPEWPRSVDEAMSGNGDLVGAGVHIGGSKIERVGPSAPKEDQIVGPGDHLPIGVEDPAA